jgi:hypothetical protein
VTEEALNGIKIPLKCVSTRVLTATGLSRRILERIKKEGNDIEKGATVSFSTPGKSRPRKKNIVAAIDNFDAEVIRRLIYNFYVIKKQR